MISRVRSRIQQGRRGENIGLPFASKRLNNALFGIHQARYYLAGADSGVGKSSFVNFYFVLEAYKTALLEKRPFKLFYYSFEISEEELIAKWVCYVISLMFDVDLHMDYIMGRIKGMTLTDEHQEMIDSALDWLSDMLPFVEIIDAPKNPTTIFNQLIEYAETIGEVHRTTHTSKKKDKAGKFIKTSYITGFTVTDPRLLVLVVVDHVALATNEQGMNKKDTIDLLSKYMVFVRNRFRFSPVMIQQFNTEMQTVERRKFKGAAFAPQRADFGDSKYTYRDADIVFGLLNPSFFDISEFYGYSVLPSPNNSQNYSLGEFFIMAFIMKNRYGQSNIQIPQFMNGMIGLFYDLPSPDQDFILENFQEMAETIRARSSHFTPKDDDNGDHTTN